MISIDPVLERLSLHPTALRAAPLVPPPEPEAEPGVELDRRWLIDNGIYGYEDHDPRARSFHMLRSQLLTGFHRGGGRILAITSTQPGDGKSYVAANLATALSRIHPTVLVDLDLRRPAIATSLGLALAAGIDDFLDGDVPLERSGVRVAEPGAELVIHAVRTARERSTRMLNPDRLARLFGAIRASPGAPLCIVDTPPILVLDDIVLIAREADGVLLIAEEGRTRAEDLAHALRLLAPTPIVGSVLNKSLTGSSPERSYGYYARSS